MLYASVNGFCPLRRLIASAALVSNTPWSRVHVVNVFEPIANSQNSDVPNNRRIAEFKMRMARSSVVFMMSSVKRVPASSFLCKLVNLKLANLWSAVHGLSSPAILRCLTSCLSFMYASRGRTLQQCRGTITCGMEGGKDDT